jgi:hypothetical protein
VHSGAKVPTGSLLLLVLVEITAAVARLQSSFLTLGEAVVLDCRLFWTTAISVLDCRSIWDLQIPWLFFIQPVVYIYGTSIPSS